MQREHFTTFAAVTLDARASGPVHSKCVWVGAIRQSGKFTPDYPCRSRNPSVFSDVQGAEWWFFFDFINLRDGNVRRAVRKV
jgi:hypothetical protein